MIPFRFVTLEKREEIFRKLSTEKFTGAVVSINDLREKEFSGKKLTPSEQLALCNFDRFRIYELNSVTDEESFHHRYRELQVIANLGDYREFLDGKYTGS